jgi:K+/H+ antiporter YhaU regulatory subunit KhtT
MQTERVTFLTSPEHKAALDAFAARSGQSVGNVVREATVQYIHQGQEDEAQLAALVEQVNEAIPKMEAALDEMSRKMRETHAEVDAMLRAMGARS